MGSFQRVLDHPILLLQSSSFLSRACTHLPRPCHQADHALAAKTRLKLVGLSADQLTCLRVQMQFFHLKR